MYILMWTKEMKKNDQRMAAKKKMGIKWVNVNHEPTWQEQLAIGTGKTETWDSFVLCASGV